ncbi:phosphotransferase enzyme family protein [Phenylobacterium sp.]|uniref:phosphotransferase enzyme family protein n=1 Tax=Phenylobacterium sp. TaxID=1871053 RepID=UPI002735A3A5|nr:phosphotransferase [Phenylobacterium sp.]MDP3853042.1 phosphotransferase [Phenylobacterium sp.]
MEFEVLGPLSGGGGGATVELVRAAGRLWVLKQHRPREAAAERRFHQILRQNGIPSLHLEDWPGLGSDQLLLEYVQGSPTIGGSPSPALCRRWGAAVSALHWIRSDSFKVLDEQGDAVPAIWREFIAARIREAIDRHHSIGTDLPQSLLDKAEHRLASLLSLDPDSFVLTHGDLHLNNALVRGGEIVLFDKPADVWVAPVVFDLCLVFSEAFPGARYGADRPGDGDRLSAFLDGYGEFPSEQSRWLEHFVLLRSLSRYPSPFVPELRSIIEIALDRLDDSLS